MQGRFGPPHKSNCQPSILKRLSRIMKISARNILKGKVIQIVQGAVNSEVTLEVAPGVEIVSIITKTSAQSLGLSEGKDAFAVIKASNVMIAVE